MNFTKNWKRFWTLSRRSEGFTLVELIVVIAIIAILGGVATVGYSGYVKKANMQADMTLASEVENALLLAYYNQQLDENSSVVLSVDKDVQVEGDAAAALEAAFGANWASLRLSYDGWDTVSGGMSWSELYNNINGSTFDANEETLSALLNDVQNVVAVLTGAISGGLNIESGSALEKYLLNAGIEVDKSNAQAISNAAVMYVADGMKNTLNTDAKRAEYATTWATSQTIPDFSDTLGTMANLSARYAYVEALARYVDSKAGTTYAADLYAATNGTDVVDAGTMLSQLNIVQNSMMNDENCQPYIITYFGVNTSTGTIDDPSSSLAYKDAMAFLSYMQGVGACSDSLLSGTDLTKTDYYNDGTIADVVTSYVNIGAAAVDGSVSDGAVVIYFNYATGMMMCIPLDSLNG